ncbi:venom serine protease [Halyomorpha halys]|uniref:venom serine protease n=1 Tax=Halyomorpha halys TaxID=286706 RepID=UPI0006D504DC|nr:venom serine protease-like [Halyomorpha halys]
MLMPCVSCHTTIKMLAICFTLLLAEALGQGCNINKYISLASGSHPVRSPGHPGPYPPSSECYYYYHTDPGYRLTMDCYDVEMGQVPWDCSDSIKFVGSLNADDIDFCSPINVQSRDHRIVMILRSTQRSMGGRFSCSVRAMRRELCDCGWSSSKRIVGGRETGINEFPFMVSIVNAKLRSHACGGSIISSRYVLTAAHCLEVLDVAFTGLLVGEHNMSTGSETSVTRLHRAAQFIIHPAYNSSTSWNDIGLILSATPFAFSLRVGPVCLPFNRPALPQVGDLLTALGWGTIFFGGPTSEVLQKVQLEVVPERTCIAAFNRSASSGKQVCTFTPGKDTCQMDSGGPLVAHDVRTARMMLSSIVSFGGACGDEKPAVNTRVASYLDWIQQATNENFCIK